MATAGATGRRVIQTPLSILHIDNDSTAHGYTAGAAGQKSFRAGFEAKSRRGPRATSGTAPVLASKPHTPDPWPLHPHCSGSSYLPIFIFFSLCLTSVLLWRISKRVPPGAQGRARVTLLRAQVEARRQATGPTTAWRYPLQRHQVAMCGEVIYGAPT